MRIEERLPPGEVVNTAKLDNGPPSPDDGSLGFTDFLILPFVPFVIFTGDLIELFVPERDQLDHTLDAIKREDWEAGYRLLEDFLTSDDEILQHRALQLFKVHPD